MGHLQPVPPVEEPVLGVTRVGEVSAAAGSSVLERRDFELLLFVVTR